MSKLCLPTCTYIAITTATIYRLAFWTLLNSLAFMLWCSGAISGVCIACLVSCSMYMRLLYHQLYSLLMYMDTFDVTYTCLSCVSLHVMYRFVTPIRLHSGSLTSCHVTALHAPCVSLWWPACLQWTWDTLSCPHTCMYTCSPVSFSWHSMDMWYMCGLYWTLLLGQVTHDRCCQCLLVLSGGTMLQWCWLGSCQGRNC